MIRVITSNNIPNTKITDYVDNFSICYLHTVPKIPYNYDPKHPQFKYIFELYYQEDAEIEEMEDTNDMSFKYHPVKSISESLKKISEYVIYDIDTEAEKSEDSRDDIAVITCCSEDWNGAVTATIDRYMSGAAPSFSCLNMYKYMKVTRIERIKNTLMQVLNTKFIYPEDPVSFAYALHKAISEMM